MTGTGGEALSTLMIPVGAVIGWSEILIAAWTCVLANSIRGELPSLIEDEIAPAGEAGIATLQARVCAGTQVQRSVERFALMTGAWARKGERL